MKLPPAIWGTVLLIVAAVLQMTLVQSLAIGASRPDFIVVVLACTAVRTSFVAGAGLGVWSGALMAAITGVNYGSFLASRALTGVLCGLFGEAVEQGDAIIPALTAFAATWTCEGIYYLMSPAHRGLWWLEHIALESVYNAVLAIPISALLGRFGMQRRRASPFATAARRGFGR